MKVTNDYNTHTYQPPRTNTKDKGFADMLANQSQDVKDTEKAHSTSKTSNTDDVKSVSETVNEQSDINTATENAPYLSQEQAEYLAGKYDVNNLSREDEQALMNDLQDMGIISKDENTKVYARLAMVPPDWMHGGLKSVSQHWTSVGEDILIPSGVPYPSHYSATGDMSLYDYLQNMIADENRLYSEGAEKYGEDNVAYMTDLMQTHQKMFDVLEQIKAAA